MGILGSLFGKKKQELKEAAAKFENKDMMEATVAAGVLIAYADGECEDSELLKMSEIFESLPELQCFGSEVSATLTKYEQIMKAGFRLGEVKLLREIEDVKASAQEKELVFVTALTVAEADGEIEPEELAVLKKIAQKLGLNLRDYGIE